MSIFICEYFFFLTNRWRLIIAGVVVDGVVRGEFGFGACFRATFFFVFCVVLCVVRFRSLFFGDIIIVCCPLSFLVCCLAVWLLIEGRESDR